MAGAEEGRHLPLLVRPEKAAVFISTHCKPGRTKKIQYLFDNQVNKVISEDLVLAAEFRKPEQLKRFYVSLLEKPGREVSITALSKDLGIMRTTNRQVSAAA